MLTSDNLMMISYCEPNYYPSLKYLSCSVLFSRICRHWE